MKNFIEITVLDKEQTKILLNPNAIFVVEPYRKQGKIVGSVIKFLSNGGNDSSYRYCYSLESYEEVKELIRLSYSDI
jgi:hypothetical protein